jgi:glycosyltransferase involved in cell wall biosynthesis
MAAGKPVIALRRGGAIETVVEGRTGLFFDEQSVDVLERTLLRFEEVEQSFDPAVIARHARQFSRVEFKRRMVEVLEECAAGEPSLRFALLGAPPLQPESAPIAARLAI